MQKLDLTAKRIIKDLLKLEESTRHVDEYGRYEWRLPDGTTHRKYGPAVEDAYGYQEFRINGVIHRENGPAIIFDDGYVEYWVNGKRHRLDGPACEWPVDFYSQEYSFGTNAKNTYWIDGVSYSKKEYIEKLMEMGLSYDN